jgi:hypothetical protein
VIKYPVVRLVRPVRIDLEGRHGGGLLRDGRLGTLDDVVDDCDRGGNGNPISNRR